LSDDLVTKFYNDDKTAWDEKIRLTHAVRIENMLYEDRKPWSQGVNYATPPFAQRLLKKSEISLSIKHLLAWIDICEKNLDYGILLEDDVIIFPGLTYDFNEQLKKTPDDWDLIFFGSGDDHRVPERTDGRGVYKMTPPRVKCTDSYAVSNKAAKKLRDLMFPVSMPLDFELQYFVMKHDLAVYWFEPPLVMQGSQLGTTPSLLR
jgi:GR25 family glycosyltransferase involved in LPS biosynthesis